MSASHNPGGPDEDFGIKFNGKNGGPAPEYLTEEIFKHTQNIDHYFLLEGYGYVDTDTIIDYVLPKVDGSPFEHIVSVIDNTAHYVQLMKSLFNFKQIKALISRKDFSMCFDGMHGVSGPYA